MTPPTMDIEKRFMLHVQVSETCWLWTACTDRDGYGLFTIRRNKQMVAHRWAYQRFVGPIAAGMEVDHVCHTKSCVRPDHLRAATRKQNSENRKGRVSGSRSGYLGVSWASGPAKWHVAVVHNGRKYFGGEFSDLQEAAQAARRLRNQLNDDPAKPLRPYAACPRRHAPRIR